MSEEELEQYLIAQEYFKEKEMKYTLELNETQRNLLLKAVTEMMTDKEFDERDLAGEIYLSLVYAEAENETGGKHFTED